MNEDLQSSIKYENESDRSLEILLIEDNCAHAESIEELLAEAKQTSFAIIKVQRLRYALELLSNVKFDAILLDLSLPDSQGLDTIAQTKAKAQNIPIIVLTALNDRNQEIAALRQGAQDYLVKGKFDGELLAKSIRYSIERQNTQETLRQQAERERLMVRMVEKIRQSLDLDEILQATVEEVRQFLNGDLVFIYRCYPDKPGKIVAQSFKKPSDAKFILDSYTSLNGFYFPSFDSPFTQTLEKLTSSSEDLVNIEDVYEAAQAELKAFLVLPLSPNSQKARRIEPINKQANNKQNSSARLWGVLVAHNYLTVREWQEKDIAFLKQLSEQVTIAIEQSELYTELEVANQKLEELVNRDGLTNVANRRHFDSILNSEWQRLAREKQALSAIMCDVDFFKNYNDTYGHIAGDRCLQKIAQVLQKSVRRPADLVARYGGEEFAIILPNTDANGALHLAQQCHHQLEKLKLPHAKSPLSQYVTVSMGIATIIPYHNEDPLTLINAADRALYQAKQNGRNQIFVMTNE